MNTRCVCCDLPIESCGKEAERRQRIAERERRDALRAHGYFPSAYGGTCVNCGTGFGVDAMIHRAAEGYIGECCWDALVSPLGRVR